MITPVTNKPNWKIALGIPFLIFASCFLITRSSAFKTNNELLSNGIILDLLITAPLLYFLAIRKTNVSKLTVSRVFITGLLFAGLILNSRSNSFLPIIKTWISPVIEVLVIFLVAKKFYAANKIAKASNKKADFLMHCRTILFHVTGNEKIGNIISTEIAVMYYAFFGTASKSIDNKTIFSSYKENGLPLVLGTVLSIFLIETTGVHFLLSIWNKTVAWTVTGLSLYTCMQIFAHIRALKARPIILHTNSFEVHNGLAGDAYVDFDNIEKIELSTKIPAGRESVKISLLKVLENHNIVVYLKNPIEVTKLFGIKKQTNTILFYVDRPKEFEHAVNIQLTDYGIR